jgi:hypothetical protein
LENGRAALDATLLKQSLMGIANAPGPLDNESSNHNMHKSFLALS